MAIPDSADKPAPENDTGRLAVASHALAVEISVMGAHTIGHRRLAPTGNVARCARLSYFDP